MPRKQPTGLTRFFRNFIRQSFAGQARTSDRKSQRRLKFESLEGRQLLASDLGAITGIVSTDSPIVGVTINLYADDGDGVFEPATDDSPATADLTDATGRYRFDRLAAGGYWIEQPEQTVGTEDLGLFVSPLITISAAQADGTAGTVIDNFADTPAASITADLLTSPNSLAADHAGALGGERDMIVTLTSGLTLPSVTLSSAGNMLVFDSSADAQGLFNVIYDGNDDDASALAATGLAGIDLTQSGVNTAVKVRVQADQANATVRLRVYTDATNFSDSAAVTIPSTNTPEDFVFHFSQFTPAGGTGANFANVGAIDLLIDTNTNATDGIVTVLGAFAPIAVTQDIDNEIDLSLDKSVDTSTPVVGQNVTFTITITNPAGGPEATGIVVTDLLPTGLTFVSASESQGTYTENDGVWNVGSIDSGSDATLQIVATVTTGAAVVNAAAITTADQPDTNVANNTDDETVDAVATADLSLVKDVSNAAPNLNSNVTFTLTLTNSGPDAASGVVVTDQLPTGLTFVSATPSGTSTYSETTGVWAVGTVDTTTPATLSIVATVNSTAAITNTAQVTASAVVDPDSTPNDGQGDDFDTVVVDAAAAADLALTKSASSLTPSVGSNVTFTLTLTNSGPDDATGVQVTDLLPGGLTFVSATPSGTTTYNQTTGVWDVGTLGTLNPATLQIVATVTSTAAIVNSAQVTASGVFDPDSTPNDGQGDDFDSETIDAPNSADLSLVKTASSLTPSVGSNVTFTLTLTNSGPDSATGVQVTDLLPSGLTFVSATPSGTSTYNQTTGVWDVGTVSTTAPATLAIVATVNSSTAIINTAQVTASATADPDSTPNDGTGDDFDTESIDAPAAADLSLTKTASSSTPNLGANVTFTVRVDNAGPDQATGVVVTDLLPAGLVLVSSTPSQGSYVATTGVWTVGSINNGSSATLSIVARVTSTAAIDNVAQVTASGVPDPDSTPNDGAGDDRDVETIDAPAAADLRLAKTIVGPQLVNVGQNLTFRLTLNNDGPDQATGVNVTDVLPAGLTFVSSTPSQGTYNSTTGVWTVGSVNNGASATLDIVATLTTPGAKTNTASISASTEFDPDTADRQATVGAASVLLSKRRFLARPHL